MPAMTEEEGRAATEREALTWDRTPYHHRGALKGIGVDCAMFPLMVFMAVGAVPETDVGRYVRQWHLHRREEIYLGWVEKFAREISRTEVRKGDFGLWRYGLTYSHGAIILEPPVIIHATVRLGVHRDDMDRSSELQAGARDAKFFTVWG